MEIPQHTTLFEIPIATHWIDEFGIVCSVSNKTERTMEHYHKLIALYKKLKDEGGKFCLLSDATNSTPASEEIRKYLVSEMPKYVKAQAIITASPLTSTQINTFLKLSWDGFPVSQFSNEKEARDWLKKYL